MGVMKLGGGCREMADFSKGALLEGSADCSLLASVGRGIQMCWLGDRSGLLFARKLLGNRYTIAWRIIPWMIA